MIDKMLSAIPMYSIVALSVVRGSPIILLGYSIVVRGISMNFMKIPSQINRTAFFSTACALVVVTV